MQADESTPVESAASAAQPKTTNSEPPLIDWPAVVESVEGNRKLVRIMVEAALEETPQLMAALQDAVVKQDPMALRLAAHTLKSSLRYFTNGAAYKDACELENIGHERRLADADGVLTALNDSMGPVTQAWNNYLMES